MSPITTVNVDVLVMAGLPESLITMGTWYSFPCSRSNKRKDETIAIPDPLSPSEKVFKLIVLLCCLIQLKL